MQQPNYYAVYDYNTPPTYSAVIQSQVQVQPVQSTIYTTPMSQQYVVYTPPSSIYSNCCVML